ncbi:MAG: glucose/sorbosone dehydrogenase, partial [Acidobacteriota bacterium]
MKGLLLIVFLIAAIEVSAQPRLVAHAIATKDGRKFSLNLPAEFEIIPAADGFKRPRFFAKAPDGRI